MNNFKDIEELFVLHYPALVIYANKIVRDRGIAEDIVQSVFLKMIERRVDVAKINIPYIYTSVKNGALDAVKERKSIIGETSLLNHYEDNYADIESELEYVKKIQDINNAIEELPDSCKEIFKAVYFSEKRYIDVAEEMNLSLSTVKAQMYRAIKKIRTHIEKIWIIILLSHLS